MFDFAWSEIALIAVVALVVIGPKDLPRVMRTVGFWVGRARSIAREFQSSLDQMIRESELEDVRKQVEDATKVDLPNSIEKAVDPTGDLQRNLAEPLVPTHPWAEPAPPAEPAAAALPAPETPGVEPPPPAEPPTEPLPAKSGTHD
ncbi:MAG TPA: Sec-independent protein translocase protein TatB [Stellaceae bacterium]|nr:Sec-independent protein translocase protein TatB [Stellaceae bacterium]